MTKTSFQDLSGLRFGRWLVLSRAPNAASGRSRWRCRCDCGTIREVVSIHLKRGASQSCGCATPRGPANARYKHGSDHGLYSIWCNMIQRCENPNNSQYHDYGGRGISICKEWRDDFAVFAAQMGARPSRNHSIDRKDNNKGYGPDNCRWATKSEQMRNTRRNNIVEYRGRRMPLVEAAELAGVNYGTAKWRLRQGMSYEDALR